MEGGKVASRVVLDQTCEVALHKPTTKGINLVWLHNTDGLYPSKVPSTNRVEYEAFGYLS